MALVGVLLAGCGDRCEQLCANAGEQLAECKPSSLTWNDLGARSRADFVDTCRDQWGRSRIEMSASDLRLSLEACADTNAELDEISCSEVLALYGPE